MDNDTLVAGGYGLNPAIYQETDDVWAFAGDVDEEKVKVKKSESKRAAFNKFQNMATRGQSSDSKKDSGAIVYNTIHQNAIASITYLGNGVISTSGIDGRLLFWDLKGNKNTKLDQIGRALAQ